ncbi:MAG: type III-A CRISPR-associated protein Csm2 [Lachnospiraceae bacterium]|nr:type III-A CRISPR-associated protein Csm2 [Lachnospiraceae bacterium]
MAYNTYKNDRNRGYGSSRGNSGKSQNDTRTTEEKPQPITLTAETYVDTAEEIILKRIARDKPDNEGKRKICLTTSKIRNILSMVTSIYDDVIHTTGDKLNREAVEMIQYLRLRIAYEAGRDKIVRDFVEQSDLIGQVKKIGNDKGAYLLFCKYVEALVAYHRFHGGDDK